MQFSGCITALITPFKSSQKNYAVDYKQLLELLDFQISGSADGLVMCGTTGESPTLMDKEKLEIFKRTVRYVRKRIPVIAGTGTNNTHHTIQLTKQAQACGVDAALVVVPYYNKPSQEGIYQHYAAVASSVKIPIIIYNVPGRVGTSIQPETIARLRRFKNIVAVKEAVSDLDEISRVRSLSNITILSGEDSLTLPMLALGAQGVISVVSNVVPQHVSELVRMFNAGDLKHAQGSHQKLFPLSKVMFIESNPGPVKALLKILKRTNGVLRPPLAPVTKASEAKIREAWAGY